MFHRSAAKYLNEIFTESNRSPLTKDTIGLSSANFYGNKP